MNFRIWKENFQRKRYWNALGSGASVEGKLPEAKHIFSHVGGIWARVPGEGRERGSRNAVCGQRGIEGEVPDPKCVCGV